MGVRGRASPPPLAKFGSHSQIHKGKRILRTDPRGAACRAGPPSRPPIHPESRGSRTPRGQGRSAARPETRGKSMRKRTSVVWRWVGRSCAALLALLAAVGLLHLPAARSWLRRAGGCPVPPAPAPQEEAAPARP